MSGEGQFWPIFEKWIEILYKNPKDNHHGNHLSNELISAINASLLLQDFVQLHYKRFTFQDVHEFSSWCRVNTFPVSTTFSHLTRAICFEVVLINTYWWSTRDAADQRSHFWSNSNQVSIGCSGSLKLSFTSNKNKIIHAFFLEFFAAQNWFRVISP